MGTLSTAIVPPTLGRRRALLGAAALGSAAAGSRFPGTAQAQLMVPPVPPGGWLTEGVRFVAIGPHVRVQDRASGGWRGLRPPTMGGDPEQAAPDSLLPNDLDDRPSQLSARVDTAVDRLLGDPPEYDRPRIRPTPVRLGSRLADKPMAREELDNNLLRVAIQFYIRDLSQDSMFPPPGRVANVMLAEILRYSRTGLRPAEWYVGPRVTVHTVVRSQATEWLLEELDAAVTRVLRPFTTES